jgi:hypothetical protein
MGWCWSQTKFHHSVQYPLQRIANARRPVLDAPFIKILDVPARSGKLARSVATSSHPKSVEVAPRLVIPLRGAIVYVGISHGVHQLVLPSLLQGLQFFSPNSLMHQI